MCEVAGVSRAGFYRHRARQEPAAAETEIRAVVQRLALKHRYYGYRRIAVLVQREGLAADWLAEAFPWGGTRPVSHPLDADGSRGSPSAAVAAERTGPDQVRTDDLLNAIEALCQLSYEPIRSRERGQRSNFR